METHHPLDGIYSLSLAILLQIQTTGGMARLQALQAHLATSSEDHRRTQIMLGDIDLPGTGDPVRDLVLVMVRRLHLGINPGEVPSTTGTAKARMVRRLYTSSTLAEEEARLLLCSV